MYLVELLDEALHVVEVCLQLVVVWILCVYLFGHERERRPNADL